MPVKPTILSAKRPKAVIDHKLPLTPLQVGDLVYVKSDRDKSRTRDRYIIVSIDGEWCFIKKFSGSQLRATSYKVKLAECYAVPNILPPPSYHSVVPTFDDDECQEIAEQPQLCQQPSVPPDLLRPPSPDPSASTPDMPNTKKTPPPLTLIVFLSQFHLNQDPSGRPTPSILAGVHS